MRVREALTPPTVYVGDVILVTQFVSMVTGRPSGVWMRRATNNSTPPTEGGGMFKPSLTKLPSPAMVVAVIALVAAVAGTASATGVVSNGHVKTVKATQAHDTCGPRTERRTRPCRSKGRRRPGWSDRADRARWDRPEPSGAAGPAGPQGDPRGPEAQGSSRFGPEPDDDLFEHRGPSRAGTKSWTTPCPATNAQRGRRRRRKHYFGLKRSRILTRAIRMATPAREPDRWTADMNIPTGGGDFTVYVICTT